LDVLILRKIKTLIVTNQFPSDKLPYKGTFIYTQTNEIMKNSVDVVVLSPNYLKEKKIVEYNGIKNYRFKTFTKDTKDPLLKDLFKGIRGIIALFLFVLIQTFSAIRIIKNEKIDIVHAHWILPSGFSSYLATKITRRNLIITTHGSDITFCSKNKILRKFICHVLPRINYLVCVSQKLNALSQHICKKNIKSKTILIGISNSINAKQKLIPVKKSKLKKRLTRIIFAGSLYHIKGISYLLESILLLSKKRDDFIFDLVGYGEKYDEYRKFIEINKLEKFVKMYGFKSHLETISLIQKADIAIQSSLSEGLSVFIQEAIFFGKAIIATNVGGTKEVVIDNHNGYLIEIKNPNQIVEKINFLLDNPNQIKKFSENSLVIAQDKLSLEKNVKEIVNIYQHILSS